MPCNSDYMRPTQREQERQRACQLYCYLTDALGQKPPAWAVQGAKDLYCQVDSVAMLCGYIKTLDDKSRDSIIYNTRSKESRELATWWEEHLKADAERERRESEQRRQASLKEQALAKLTPEERKALGH